jgi:benzoyl-CoA reductase/2-hydroxyglutaryl-CoA dehydratase subunit BcrC/BadD/HgdB
MKRVRDEKYTRENGIKMITSGKVIYHCRFCKFIACTEGNIENHVKAKHPVPIQTIPIESEIIMQ